jgi:hypothetical protein
VYTIDTGVIVDTVTRTLRVTPETLIKLNILRSTLRKPQHKILELAIDLLWVEKSDQVTTTISERKVGYNIKKVIEKLRVK